MSSNREQRAVGGGQAGVLMVGVVVILAVMLILSTVVFQGWQDVKRRDDEAEMIFRAQEIVRAIDRYRKDRGTPPTSLEQLIEPGSRGQYFARRLYEDPLVEDGQWGLLYIGPNNEIIDPQGQGPGALEIGTARERLSDQLARRRSKLEERGIDFRRRPSNLNPAQKQAIGLMPIGGVKSLCTEQPFRVYKGRTEYREWLFTLLDLMAPGQRGALVRGGRGGIAPANPGSLNPGTNPGSPNPRKDSGSPSGPGRNRRRSGGR